MDKWIFPSNFEKGYLQIWKETHCIFCSSHWLAYLLSPLWVAHTPPTYWSHSRPIWSLDSQQQGYWIMSIAAGQRWYVFLASSQNIFKICPVTTGLFAWLRPPGPSHGGRLTATDQCSGWCRPGRGCTLGRPEISPPMGCTPCTCLRQW